jgi:MFS family permease
MAPLSMARVETDRMNAEPPASLSRNGAFNTFWAGQIVSSIGDGFTLVALPLLVLRLRGSILAMTSVSAALAGGALVSGLVVGSFVDRVPRRRVLLTCDIARAALMLSIPVLGAMGLLSIWSLGVIAFLLGFAENTFTVSATAFMLELVRRPQLIDANARLQGVSALTYVIGPAIAGLTCARFGPETALALDAGTFVISAACLVMIRPFQVAGAETAVGEGKLGGLHFLRRTPALRVIVLLLMVETIATASALDMFTYHLKKGLGQGDVGVGVTFGIASIGAVLGALAAPTVRRWVGARVGFALAYVLLAAATAAAPASTVIVEVVAAATLFTFALSLRGVYSVSLRQEVTPPALLGRVNAVVLLLVRAPRPAAALYTGWISEAMGVKVAFMIASVVLVVLATASLRSRALHAISARS